MRFKSDQETTNQAAAGGRSSRLGVDGHVILPAGGHVGRFFASVGERAALAVVEDLGELEDRRSQPVPRWPVVAIEQFDLLSGEAALCDRVVSRCARAAHAAHEP